MLQRTMGTASPGRHPARPTQAGFERAPRVRAELVHGDAIRQGGGDGVSGEGHGLHNLLHPGTNSSQDIPGALRTPHHGTAVLPDVHANTLQRRQGSEDSGEGQGVHTSPAPGHRANRAQCSQGSMLSPWQGLPLTDPFLCLDPG